VSGKSLYSMACGHGLADADNNAIRVEDDGGLAAIVIGADPMYEGRDEFKTSARFPLLPSAALGMGDAMVAWARRAMGKPAEENPAAACYSVPPPCLQFVMPARGECCTHCGAHKGLHPDAPNAIAEPEPVGCHRFRGTQGEKCLDCGTYAQSSKHMIGERGLVYDTDGNAVLPSKDPDIASELHDVFDHVEGLLAAESAGYATAVLAPRGAFSHASAVDRLLVRLDDTLGLLRRGVMSQEDAEEEMLLALVLMRIARKREME
jgi:hypothetical protein